MQVVLPWRDNGDPYRRAHHWRLREWYADGGFTVVGGDTAPGTPFNRSGARNAGVAAATSPIVAVVDADNLIPVEQLWQACQIAMADRPRLVKPFSWFAYLSQQSTDEWYAGLLPGLAAIPGLPPPRPALPVAYGPTVTYEGTGPALDFNGGAYVMRRTAWLEIGGFDEEFTGWGGEDDAFTLLARHHFGDEAVVEGTDFHLWHPSSERVTSTANYQRLLSEYVQRLGTDRARR